MNQDLAQQQIQNLKNEINQVKNTIADTKTRQSLISNQPIVTQGQGLHQNLSSILPGNLVPGNVGQINKVAWNFYYAVNFDLSETQSWIDIGGDGGIDANTKQTRSFQVSQEAAFIFMGIMRKAEDYSSVGDLGPLAIDYRDRQSSRFFNDNPIPIQNIARKGYMTYLAVPMLLMPNASFELTLSSYLEAGVTQDANSGDSGKHQFVLYGYRTRVEDAANVLSLIFGKR